MIFEATLGLLFMLGWALFYASITRTKSLPKAILGVFLLFAMMLLFEKWRYEHGSPLGWFIGTAAGFFVGLKLVQRYGPNLTEESAVAMLVIGPVILAALFIVVLLV